MDGFRTVMHFAIVPQLEREGSTLVVRGGAVESLRRNKETNDDAASRRDAYTHDRCSNHIF